MHDVDGLVELVDVVAVELAGVGERRQPARWHTSLARRRPIPAMTCWSRRKPWSRIECSFRAGPGRALSIASASGPRPASGSCSSGSPSTTHTPALRSVPASVSSRARHRRSATGPGRCEAWPTASRRGSRPPCMRWTTKVTSPKSSSRCLPRRPTKTSSWPCGLGRGLAVFRTVKVRGVKARSSAPRRTRRRAARRGPGSRAAQARSAREHVVDGGQRPGAIDHRPQVAAEPEPALHEGGLGGQLARWMASAVARSWVNVRSGSADPASLDAPGRRTTQWARRPLDRPVRRDDLLQHDAPFVSSSARCAVASRSSHASVRNPAEARTLPRSTEYPTSVNGPLPSPHAGDRGGGPRSSDAAPVRGRFLPMEGPDDVLELMDTGADGVVALVRTRARPSRRRSTTSSPGSSARAARCAATSGS